MAKAPLAKDDSDATRRKERRTMISAGPVPVPPKPTPPEVSEAEAEAEAKAKAKANLKKTQMIMGAPPLPPAITGKTQIPTGPPAPAIAPRVKAKPHLPREDDWLPSHQQTAVGPAPAPPVPRPKSKIGASGPVPKPVTTSDSDEMMAKLMGGGGGLFDDFEDELSTKIHAPASSDSSADSSADSDSDSSASPVVADADADASADDHADDHADASADDHTDASADDHADASADDHAPVPTRRSAKPPTQPNLVSSVPIEDLPRATSGPAPRASGKHDALPPPAPRNESTQPQLDAEASAETQLELDRPMPGRKGTQMPPRAAARPSRANTAMQGTGGLAAPSPDAPKIRLVPGKVIPGTRYEIRRWLGEGGMGVVYEVAHADIERRSALKILRFDLSHQPQMAQVFRDEARAASRLGSPYIVEVYDFGELSDGRLYFAMELLEGKDLVPPDEQTSMEPARLIGILRQVCKGLAKAHEAGVVHRDVKPENIILCENETRRDAVKIVDFGISAMLAAGEARAGIAGTPHYMAPEQILGEEFDGRLDIYALGCTAYELLVGAPPFDADDVESVLKQQVNAVPPSPREARPELHIPAALEAVILRCLAKQPDARYADMADLEAALCEAQISAGLTTAWDDLPVPPLPDDERYQRIVARMPSLHAAQPKRAWVWPVVAGASALAAAGLAAFLVFGRQPTEQQKDEVEQLTIEAREAASRASWVYPPPHLEGSDTALRKIVQLEGVEGRAEGMADERADELRHEFATTLIGHGDRLWNEAKGIARQYYVWSLIFEPSDYADERAGIDPLTLATIRRSAIEGDFGETEVLFASAALMKVVDDPDAKDAMVDAFNQKMQETGDMAPSVLAQLTEQAERAGMRVVPIRRGSGARGAGEGRSGRGDADDVEEGLDPSEEDLTEAVDDAGQLEGDDVLVVNEEGEEVEEEASSPGRRKRRRQVDLGLDGKAKSDPGRSKQLTEQADAKRQQGLRGEAKNLYGQAIAANPRNGQAHLGLALVHFDLASYDKARKSAQAAVKYSPRDGRAHKVLGDAYYKAYRYQDAESAYEDAQRHGVNVGKRLTDVREKLGK